mgnify:CR=1 FL=1
MQVRERLARRAAKAGLSLSQSKLTELEAYFELLRKWNQRVALTALPVERIGDEAVDRLLIEPCLASRHLPDTASIAIDVGSGGGSPAIPMKIMVPRISMLMVESKARKSAFLREAVRHLGLADTHVESVRFEELLVRPELHDLADVVTLRAVRTSPKTLTALQSFLKPGGSLFLFTTSGSHIPPTPQLSHLASHALLSSLGSHLEILRRVA